ncbi:MAG: LamG domain-containing protein [Phycisphaerae bacterium]
MKDDTHFAPGKLGFGSALEFDGAGDFGEIADSSQLHLSSGSFTIYLRVYPHFDLDSLADDPANDVVLIAKNDTGSNLPAWIYKLDTSTDKQQFATWNPTDTLASNCFGNKTSWNANQWYDLAVVFNGTGYQFYVDGLDDGYTTDSDQAEDNTGEVCIGDHSDATTHLYFDGLFDCVMMWNRSLSASEIAQVYREPFCMFEEAMRPKLIGGQIVNLVGSSVALSSSSATAKAMRKVGGNVVSTTDVTAILNLFRSLLYIESNWKREALFNGMTANAFKLGTTLSLGWFWVRVAGCSVLYRGSSMEEIDFVNILAVAEQDACEISPPNYISHNSGSTYFYVVRRFNNCGYQECTLAASVKVSIESTGELAKGQPNKVFDSRAELVDGDKIKLVWYYCPLEQKSQPMCFNVYYDGRSGQINYENPLAIIGYKGRKFYSYQCGALEAGRYLFSIRTEDTSGIENSSLAQLRIQFDPTNPEAIDILSAEGV